MNNELNNNIQQQQEEKKKPDLSEKQRINRLVISVINFFVIAPIVLYFCAVWFLFGAFSQNTILYYGILIGILIYYVASFVIMVSSIVKAPKENSKTGIIVKIIIVIILLIILLPFIKVIPTIIGNT